ncbi:MAG: 50S ribosomal protein L25 [SAR202 cluster bacterium]|nr:50S ribosomal protein L25 [SAR202 cluster bacterium]
MDILSIKLAPRTVTGKKVKQLRRQGIVPVHFYGEGTAPQSLQVDALVLRRLVPKAGTNHPVSVEIDGGKGENICFLREIQRHPVTEDYLHVDFIRVDVTHKVEAEVPIITEGEAPALASGGILYISHNHLTVEALPLQMPDKIHINLAPLTTFDKAIRVEDIKLAEGIRILMDPHEVLVKAMPQAVDRTPVGAAAAAAAEGEAAKAPEATAQKGEAKEAAAPAKGGKG